MSWLPATIQERLVIVLAHFVWQGVAVAALLVALVAMLNLKRPSARYASSLLAFVLMSACPIVTWFAVPGVRWLDTALHQSNEQLTIARQVGDVPNDKLPNLGARWPASTVDQSRDQPSFDSDVDTVIDGGLRQAAALQGETTWLDALRPFEPWIIGVWLCGVGVLSLRLLLGAIGLWRWRRAVELLPESLAPIVERLCATMSMTPPRVRVCRRVAEAVAIGLFKPMILLLAAWIMELPPDMLEAVLAHELAHVRRLDLWVNLLQRLVETLLFYHPAMWWLSHRLRTERELCCDELAATVTNDRVRYAETLEHVARLSRSQRAPNLAVAMSGREGVLLHRVRQLLGVTPPPRSGGAWLAGAMTLGLVLAFALGTFVSSRAEADKPVADSKNNAERRPTPNDRVVATVNGDEFHESEVLARYHDGLAKLRGTVSAETFQKQCDALIQRDLKVLIESRLLVQEAKRTFTAQQLADFERDRLGFNDELARLREQFEVETDEELEKQLQAQGTSCAALRARFCDQILGLVHVG